MQANPRELSWQAIQAIVGVKLSVDVLRFDDMGWHLPQHQLQHQHQHQHAHTPHADSDVEIIEDEPALPDTSPEPEPEPAQPAQLLDSVSAQHFRQDETDGEPEDDLDGDPETALSMDQYLEVTLSTDSESVEPHLVEPDPPPKPEDKRHGCHVCVEKFSSYWELRRHINTHFPGMLDSKSSFCHLCQKDYTKTGFMNHLRKHTGERPFVCELCRKAFSQSSSLSIHMKFHLNVRKHACTVCEKKFVTKSELSRHMTVHTKQKSYYCGVCDKAFTRSDNMKKHEKTHG